MALNNFIFFLVLIIFSFIFNKYFISFLNKYNPKLLVDDQFNKPQAFHENPVSTLGGAGIFFSFFLVYLYFFLFQEILYLDYMLFCTLFFCLGFIDDLKVKFSAKIRLLFMIIFLILLVHYNDLYLENTGIEFLNIWISNSKIFSLIFICLCFLFVINGANLIDGYNGLLGIHSLIILINLFFINYLNGFYDLSYFILSAILILIIFIKFNFPKSKLFLGDSGSYFLGTFVAISVIKTSILNPEISPFYFCILLFYLFFEVFFSFLRKVIVEKKSPIHPDGMHLHMMVYNFLYKKNKDKFKSNYSVSIILNLIYLILIAPAIVMMTDGMFCKYYSLIFFLIYMITYKIINDKIKQ